MNMCEEQRPFIPEGSDTQLRFHISEETTCWEETDIDLTEYDKVALTVKFWNGDTIDIEGTVDTETTWNVSFDILSEQTAGRTWVFKAEVWWIAWAEKHRFNQATINGDVLASLRIPQWIVSD